MTGRREVSLIIYLAMAVLVVINCGCYAVKPELSSLNPTEIQMQYINFVNDVPHTAPVATRDAEYLKRAIPALRPLSDEEYLNGPAAILQTMAPYSYVLYEEDLFWCIEWDPGLIVIRFSPNGDITWAALRSPVPDFGGRKASDEELDAYDEDADNPQYNLIFDSWDAQFDEQKRKWKSFVPADSDVQARFQNALVHVNELHEKIQQNHDEWFKGCKENLKKWCGEGIALK